MFPSSESRIPVELVNEILQLLDPYHKPLHEGPQSMSMSLKPQNHTVNEEKFEAIRRCMFVSKTFYQLARPLFFRKISLEYKPFEMDDRPATWRLYQDVFLRKPEIAAEVREVEMSILPHQPVHDEYLMNDSSHLRQRLALDRSLLPPGAGRPWRATVGVLRMLARVSDTVDSRGGVERLVIRGVSNDSDPTPQEAPSACWDVDDPVVLALIDLRTTQTLKTLGLLEVHHAHPALLFGDYQTDALEALELVSWGGARFSDVEEAWEERLSVGLEVLSSQARRAVETWTPVPGPPDDTRRPASREGVLFPKVKRLSTTASGHMFSEYINAGAPYDGHTLQYKAFPRLQTLQTGCLNILEILDLSNLENLEIHNEGVWSVRPDRVFHNLRTLTYFAEDTLYASIRTFDQNIEEAQHVREHAASFLPIVPHVEEVTVCVIFRRFWPLDIARDLSRFAPWLACFKGSEVPRVRLDFQVVGPLDAADLALCSTIDGVVWLDLDVEGYGPVRVKVVEYSEYYGLKDS